MVKKIIGEKIEENPLNLEKKKIKKKIENWI